MKPTVVNLKGRVALIAGGAGNVGKGIVRAFLDEGAIVVVPSRSAEKLESLRDRLGTLATNRFVPLVAQTDNLEGAASLRYEVLDRFGHLDVVVASLGGWNQAGAMTGISMEAWNRVVQSNLTSHFIIARTFMPVLISQEKGSYTMLGGTSSETIYPGAGLNSITGVARLMLARVMVEETQGSGVRINALVLPGVDVASDRKGSGGSGGITSYNVGEFTCWLASDEGIQMSGNLFRLLEPPPDRNWRLVPTRPLQQYKML